MTQFRALELAITQATLQRDARARALAQANRTLEFAHGQLNQLQQYAADTDARWIGDHLVGRSAELIRHHYLFMDRLQNAVSLQQGVIANLARQRDAAHQQLMQAEYRLAGFQQVLKARRAAQQAQQQRREQRETDEFAAQRHTRNRAIQTMEEAL